MNSAATLPDEARLRALLDGTLAEAEQAEVLALVETQPQWQQALDRLAAGARTWQAAAEHLHAPPLATDAALRSAMAAVQPPTIASDQQPAGSGAKLDFLAPADDPRFLGRFNDYLIERVIGRGGFGIVLQAFDPPLRRTVALKVLAPHLASNAAACLRFAREAKAAAAVVHDHVITIHAVGDKPLPHLVMQYVAGQSLQEKLDKTGPLGTAEVLRIGMQTAAGLAAAHKHGQVHRDIKPANILLENGVERVKITDFGLARAADDASMTQSGVVAGTPQYMSPEQARGEMVDARSDLFSLGSVLYAMCAGHPPFRATTAMGVIKRVCDEPPRPIREVNPEVPDWLAAIIDKLMAKRPEDRFASAAEVSELLGQCLSHVQQPATAPLPPSRALAPRVPESTSTPPSGGVAASVPSPDDALLERARRASASLRLASSSPAFSTGSLAIVFAFLPGLIQE
jgi:serine/threonine-protein kinase